MKPTYSLALATWMLEHLTFGPSGEALSGDLLEEFRRGRSASWYRRQVLSAIGIGILRKSRDYALPLTFSIGWSVLYPIWWFGIEKMHLAQTVLNWWATVDLPFSTGLQGIGEIIPVVLFVWFGLVVYLMLRTEAIHKLSILRILASLSISFNVLLVTTVGLSTQLKRPEISLSYVARQDLSLHSHLIAVSIPLALSLLSAILVAVSRAPKRRHGPASVIG
jgi:hypothetical protein